VIEPDLWRVAQSRPGQSLKFTFVDFDQGLEVVQKIQHEMQSLQNSISLMT
jgi:allophanate hydrolase subunit 2